MRPWPGQIPRSRNSFPRRSWTGTGQRKDFPYLLTNNVLRFIEKQAGDNRRWIMVNVKGVLGSILNVLYAMVIVVCVYLLYNLINYGISLVTGTVDVVALVVEPILFGVFCTVFDLLFLYIKSLLMRLRPSRSKGGKK